MIGVDMENLARFARIAKDPKIIQKILTERERAYWDSKENDVATLAGLWCAKEAVVKALGTGFGEIAYRDAEIRHDAFGQPCAYVQKFALTLEVSISHTADACVAVAMKV